MLLDSQRTMVEAVLHAVQHSLHFSAFVDAPGATDKAFYFNLLMAAVHAHGQIALVVASSGIAVTLLTGGCTFHSCFKAPSATLKVKVLWLKSFVMRSSLSGMKPLWHIATS